MISMPGIARGNLPSSPKRAMARSMQAETAGRVSALANADLSSEMSSVLSAFSLDPQPRDSSDSVADSPVTPVPPWSSAPRPELEPTRALPSLPPLPPSPQSAPAKRGGPGPSSPQQADARQPLRRVSLCIRKQVKPVLKGPCRIDAFELGKTVGTGSFGRVVLAYVKSEPVRDKARFALKVMKKADVVRLKQVDHIVGEANLMQDLSHPFIVTQVACFQDDRRLYLLLEFMPGGELFSYLRKERVISDKAARFYASQIVLVLKYLHELNVAYRDLKPENVLLSRTGHVKLADFGFAKVVVGRTFTLCGTPEYLAPEVVQNKGHNQGVDYWALGVLVYEMMAGFPPFFDEAQLEIYAKIVKGKFDYPCHFDAVARSLISGLLTSDLTARLGCMKDGALEVMNHAWFASVKWQSVLDRLVPAPYFPPSDFEQNFDDYEHDPDVKAPKPSPADDALFVRFGPRVACDSPPWPADV